MTDTTTNTAAASLSVDELALIREEAARIADDWAEQQPVEPTRKKADAEFVRAILRLCAPTPQAEAISREAATPRFSVTYCSQCGQEFGPGDHGFSHCRNHQSGALDAAPSELPDMPANAAHVTRRIRRCENDATAQLVLEHFAIEFARAAIAAGGAQEPSATLVKCRDMKGAEWFDIKVHDRSLPDGAKLYAQPLPRVAATAWQPIETALKTGRTLLLGYLNSAGKWRTVRGQWMSEAYIDEQWEEPDDAEPGWYETAAEADDPPNCWPIEPTHWMPLPAAPAASNEEQ